MTELALLADGERDALMEHLQTEPGAAEEHIRAGGSLASFVMGWKAARDAAAEAKEISAELADQVLALPVPRWDERETVRDYLLALLNALWTGQADPKYGMTGDSDWRYDLYEPMSAAGVIRGWKDGYGIGYHEDGTQHPEDRKRADQIVSAAIRRLAGERGAA